MTEGGRCKQDSEHRVRLHMTEGGEPDYIIRIHIQYWCIDGKYRIYVSRLSNWGKTSF